MKKYIFLIILLSSHIVFFAQTAGVYVKPLVALSPADRSVNRFKFNTNEYVLEQTDCNGALYERENKRGLLFDATLTDDDSVPVFRDIKFVVSHSDGSMSGDYLPDEGYAFRDSEIGANAVYGTKSHGTIFGKASFSRGLHRGYAWNAIRHAELYRPYVLADSSGGDYHYENYFLEGGYGFSVGNVYLGVGGSYRGEIASRHTDPRCANTTSWLTLNVSSVFNFRHSNWLALKLSFLSNKQHLDLWNWRPGQQDRFFFTYGFGYYDLNESPIFFGIKRMQYVKGVGFQLTSSNIGARSSARSTYFVDLDYSFAKMKTEKSDTKNLFGANTHYLNASIWFSTPAEHKFRMSFGLISQSNVRFGRENIYESYRPDDEYSSIYDFRLVNVRKRFVSTFSQDDFLSKLSYRLPSNQLTFELLAGIGVEYRREEYKNPAQSWNVASLMPVVGLGLSQKVKRIEWGFNSSLWLKSPQQYDYDVQNEEFRLDYPRTFLPYAYYADDSYTASGQLLFAYSFNSRGMRAGVKVRYFLRIGERPSDVRYGTAPQMQTGLLPYENPERVDNHESWFRVILFMSL